MIPPKALVVLSGGQDSTTCLFWAVQRYGAENVRALSFYYGQRHEIELIAADTVAWLAGIAPENREVVNLGDGILAGTSPLTDHSAPLEQYESFAQMDEVIGDRVEKTFVPMRNALFLTVAANRAVVSGANNIITGVCQADNANYPDCRASFILQQEEAINEALGHGSWEEPGWISIHTPLMNMAKADSIHLALSTPCAYSALAYSHTAYDGSFPPTGADHATVLRAHGFEEAGFPDPLILRCWKEGRLAKPETANYGAPQVAGALDIIRGDLESKPWEIKQDWWNR
jgi:7-cyano-7-deazaguanine synthase